MRAWVAVVASVFCAACTKSESPDGGLVLDAGSPLDAGTSPLDGGAPDSGTPLQGDAGAQFFSDRFDDVGALHPQLVDVGGIYSMSSGALTNTQSQRNYVRTQYTAYNTVDFIYELDYSNAVATEYAGIVFFGIGDGAQNLQFNNEPDYAVDLHIDPTEFVFPKKVMLCVQEHDPRTNDPLQPHRAMWEMGTVEKGPHTARLEKHGDALTFSILTNGTVECSMTKLLSVEAPFLNATNSRLFFGSMQNGNLFTRFSVTPR